MRPRAGDVAAGDPGATASHARRRLVDLVTRRPTVSASRILCLVLGAVVSCRPAVGADFPQRRAGLWEVRSAGAEASGLPPSLHCIGEFADSANAHLDRSVGAKGSCTMGAFQRVGEAWVAESVCKEGRTTVTSKAIASGDFESEYRIDTVVSYESAGTTSRREDKEAVLARLIGPCPAGQRPGDIFIPNMGTLNMVDGTFRAAPAARRRAGPPPRPAASPSPPAASPSASPSNP